jgi:hypothetical protein
MIVVEARLRMIFLLQTPVVNYYGHGLPIYQTRKTYKMNLTTTYMEYNHITIKLSYIVPKLPRSWR